MSNFFVELSPTCDHVDETGDLLLWLRLVRINEITMSKHSPDKAEGFRTGGRGC
jgi:hypothetical protein